MKIEYRISSPQGDLVVGPDLLSQPFLLGPSEPHPHLTLADYFEALKGFATSRPELQGAEAIVIRSEKHGALYHIASLSVSWRDRTRKYTVSSALSVAGKSCLARDCELIDRLTASRSLPYLPAIYSRQCMSCGCLNENAEFFMVLSEWFEDYHEWHLTPDGQAIRLWDHAQGNRLLGRGAAVEVFRVIAEILTRYYDVPTGTMIHPWHHAAGDFIIKERDGAVQVRLTTVRNYRSLPLPGLSSTSSPLVALLFFFLHLTVRNRLDRVEGVAEPVWAAEFTVAPTVEGFLAGLSATAAQGPKPPVLTAQLLDLVQSCAPGELTALFNPLLAFYHDENPGEATLIAENLKEHSLCLHRTLKNRGSRA